MVSDLRFLIFSYISIVDSIGSSTSSKHHRRNDPYSTAADSHLIWCPTSPSNTQTFERALPTRSLQTPLTSTDTDDIRYFRYDPYAVTEDSVRVPCHPEPITTASLKLNNSADIRHQPIRSQLPSGTIEGQQTHRPPTMSIDESPKPMNRFLMALRSESQSINGRRPIKAQSPTPICQAQDLLVMPRCPLTLNTQTFEGEMVFGSSQSRRHHQRRKRRSQRLTQRQEPMIPSALQPPSLPIEVSIDETAKRMSLFLMAQKRKDETNQCLPNVLYQIISEFADHNDISNLYHILRSPEDRKRVLGFTSYHEMNQELPSKRSKMEYLKKGGPISAHVVYKFTEGFITGIHWSKGGKLSNYFHVQHGMFCVVSK